MRVLSRHLVSRVRLSDNGNLGQIKMECEHCKLTIEIEGWTEENADRIAAEIRDAVSKEAKRIRANLPPKKRCGCSGS